MHSRYEFVGEVNEWINKIILETRVAQILDKRGTHCQKSYSRTNKNLQTQATVEWLL